MATIISRQKTISRSGLLLGAAAKKLTVGKTKRKTRRFSDFTIILISIVIFAIVFIWLSTQASSLSHDIDYLSDSNSQLVEKIEDGKLQLQLKNKGVAEKARKLGMIPSTKSWTIDLKKNQIF
jgi:uncharacterized membrane protein